MIVGFSKLFSDIIHSTVWREEMHVKVVWVTMLAMADRHGQVMASVPGLADAAKVTLDQCLDALEKFQKPDEYSRTKDYEGRRVVEIDGGWLLLNYEKFRDRKDDEEQRIKTRERVRRHREKAKGVTENVTVTHGNDIQIQIQIADTEKEKRISSANADVETVFEYWKLQCSHPRTVLDNKRKRLIEARLKTFTVGDLKDAIDGCKRSPWHQGQNPARKIYDAIGLIFRDNEKVEEFIKMPVLSKAPTLSEEEQAAREAVGRGKELFYELRRNPQGRV